MGTVHQAAWQYPRVSKRIRPLVPALKSCPQKRGVVQKIFIQTPKKPNSAKRKVAKVKLSTGRVISCYIPGVGHKLAKHSVLLVRGGRAQDLIGVRYKPIFGKFDCVPPVGRISRLSKYGLSNKKFDQPNVDATASSAKRKRHVKAVRPYKVKRPGIVLARIDAGISSNIKQYLRGRI
jgi:small subunit ribosomal protein S12